MALLFVGMAACDRSPKAHEVIRTASGDTTTVRIPASWGADPVPVDVAVLWQDAALGEPSTLVVSGDEVWVADGDRVHRIGLGGAHVGSVGRAGQGPGEFGGIIAPGVLADTVVVVNAQNHRLSLFSSDGALIDTRRLASHPDYRNVRREQQLRFVDGGVVSLAEEIVRLDRRTRAAVLWQPLDADSVVAFAEFPHLGVARLRPPPGRSGAVRPPGPDRLGPGWPVRPRERSRPMPLGPVVRGARCPPGLSGSRPRTDRPGSAKGHARGCRSRRVAASSDARSARGRVCRTDHPR